MRRRVPKDIRYAPNKEIAHKWMSQEKRRTHKRERRERKRETSNEQAAEESSIT